MQIKKSTAKSDTANNKSKRLGKPNLNNTKTNNSKQNVDYDANDILDADNEILEEDSDIDSTSINKDGILSRFSTNQIIIGVIIIILVIGLVYLTDKGGDEDGTSSNTDITEEEVIDATDDATDTATDIEQDSNGEIETNSAEETEAPSYEVDLESSDALNPGWYANDHTTSATVYSSTDTLKDLNGVEIPAIFTVRDIAIVTEYVNYEKRRAVMDEGLELYWVEIMYSNKKYRTTIPFDTFRQLNNDGICKVEMEVLTLEGGEKVISYMKVIL